MPNKTICLILGGGVGSRLFPLTQHRSKPAVPIAGKYKLIDIPIANCLHSGLNQIFVLTQYNAASLNRHLKNTYNFDAFNPSQVEILAAEQRADNMNWYRGTADAVRQALSYIDQLEYDQLLVLSGDQLYEMDLEKMLQTHVQSNADITIATKPVRAKEATGFGIMKTNDEQRIVNFVEKPKAEILPEWKSKVDMPQSVKGAHFLASMGIYFFSKKAIHQLFEQYPDAMDFGKEIIPFALANDYKIQSHLFDRYWADIGTISSYFETNIQLARGLCGFKFSDSKKIFTRPMMYPPSQVAGTRMTNVLMNEGSEIFADTITDAVLGYLTRIGKASSIKRTIILGNDYLDYRGSSAVPAIGIGNHAVIENAIIDKNARIGNHIEIIGSAELPDGRHENYTISSGIIVIHSNAVIPDYTKIGASVKEEAVFF